jgi:hypothetical protein
MPANEQVTDQEQAAQIHSELEEKFLKILSQPDAVIPADEIEGELSEDQRATLQSVLEAEMPTPEEIERDVKIAEHNAEVQRRRDKKLARRRIRQQAKGKKRKRGR